MKTLLQKLSKRRASLLLQYDDEDLHQLRITLRRMRSRLKHQSGKKARSLRRDLGLLAETTNAARDWDTLLIRAREILPDDEFRLLLPLLEQFQQVARRQVSIMLQSEEWLEATRRWKRLEKRQSHKQDRRADSDGQDLPQRVQRVSAARLEAISRDDEKRWHKLRIAIKDLRYALDATPKNARSEEARQAIELCKSLQDDLGEWHDTVVHSSLLQEKVDSLDLSRHPQAVNALETLRSSIARQGRDRLARVKSTLDRDEILRTLSPDQPSAD